MSTTESKAQKCVHKGCGKVFTNPDEACVYHPGPPEFHEGQKGWKCCKPRVLTFDEFLEIPPCTTGKHSIVDDTPKEEDKRKKTPEIKEDDNAPKVRPISVTKPGDGGSSSSSTMAIRLGGSGSNSGTPRSTTPAAANSHLDEDSDEEGIQVEAGTSCKRRKCGKTYDPKIARADEKCVHHPGQPIFHEGSKGWTCCKRRVLEFEEFMKIEGCKERQGHCYVGKKTKKSQQQQQSAASSSSDKQGGTSEAKEGEGEEDEEEVLDEVRSDYYQTSSSVIVSYFLKKIDRDRAKVSFSRRSAQLDLPTTDGKRFKKEVEWWGDIDPAKSEFKIMGTKLEMTLAKDVGADSSMLSWPVLRVGDRETGERIQLGRAGRA